MRTKSYSERDFIRILKANGYVKSKDTGKGDHDKWFNEAGDMIVITAGRPPNKMIIRRLIKEHKLKDD